MYAAFIRVKMRCQQVEFLSGDSREKNDSILHSAFWTFDRIGFFAVLRIQCSSSLLAQDLELHCRVCVFLSWSNFDKAPVPSPSHIPHWLMYLGSDHLYDRGLLPPHLDLANS